MSKRHYAWWGVDRQGNIVRGETQATSSKEVPLLLRQQRIRVTRVQRQFDWPAWLKFKTQPHLSTRPITQFTRQLATLLRAGVPLLQALDILAQGESNIPLKTLIQQLHLQIESGMPFHKALSQHAAFDDLYCNLIAVGELAGLLDTMLDRLAHHLEKSEALRSTIRSALVYPIAVLSIAAAVLMVILIFVVPAFQSIFASFGAELPWLTQGVIALSEGVQHHGLWVALLIGIGTGWVRLQIRRRLSWRRALHRLLLRIPIAGPLTRHACTARWTRTLATLFFAGVPLTESLKAVENVTGNLLFQSATQHIQAQLMQGQALSQAIQQTGELFPLMVAQMCAIGEESGALDRMLQKTAEHYEHEVDHAVARLSTLLEPFIMVVLGLLIGGLVMALYLPIFQLGQVV